MWRASGVMGGTIVWTGRTRKIVIGGTEQNVMKEQTMVIVHVTRVSQQLKVLMLGPKKKNQNSLVLSGEVEFS